MNPRILCICSTYLYSAAGDVAPKPVDLTRHVPKLILNLLGSCDDTIQARVAVQAIGREGRLQTGHQSSASGYVLLHRV